MKRLNPRNHSSVTCGGSIFAGFSYFASNSFHYRPPLTSKSFDCSSMICNPTSGASSTKIDKCNSTGVHFWRHGLAWNADEKGYIEKTVFLLLRVMQFVENVNRKDFASVCKSEIPSFIYFCKSLYWIGLYILIQLLLTVELLCPSEFVNVNAIPLTIQ